jgi:site-specific DNA-methyltransferase (adenine-specific)
MANERLAKRSEPVGLLKVEEARDLLAKAKTVDEAKRVRDQAEAIDIYLRRQNASTAAIADAQEIKLWAERRIGEITREMGKIRGRPNKADSESALSLQEVLGTKSKAAAQQLASRCEALAEIPEQEFAEDVQKARAAGERPGAKIRKKVKHKRERARAAKAAKAAPERALIHKQLAGDFLRGLKTASVDLLLTDPPYSTDVEDILGFSSWLPKGLRALKPTGRAYVCIGAYPAELHAYLEQVVASEYRDRSQVLVWTYRNTKGPAPRDRYKLNWQAILYLWGPDAPPLDCPSLNELDSVQDINAPDGRLGNRYHAWQKPDELGERFVRHATKPGDLVVDPFAGTGTFLLAAARLGRRAIGCDISQDNLRIAVTRGCLLEGEAQVA